MENEPNNRNYVNKKHADKLLRQHFVKHIIPLVLFIYFIYLWLLLLNHNRLIQLRNLTELNKCPACYGISACSAVYSGQIKTSRLNESLTTYHATYAKTNEKLVLKKLADKNKLQKFDDNFCQEFGLQCDCGATDLYKNFDLQAIKEKINKSVHWNFNASEYDEGRHLVFCPYLDGLYDFLQPVFGNNSSLNKARLINVWTMLKINVEPILLARMADHQEFPIPQYGGCCGRMEVVSQTGVPLSSLTDLNWRQRANIAGSLIEAAQRLTFKDPRYRYYMMDWSKDNILSSSDNRVTFASYDNMIVLDTYTGQPKIYVPAHEQFPLWYTRYHRRDNSLPYGQSREHINNVCSYYLSDHNFWELCNLFTGGEEPFLMAEGYLSGLTEDVVNLLVMCQSEYSDKFAVVTNMQFQLMLLTSRELDL